MNVAECNDVATLADELGALRRHLDDLARVTDDDLKRYQLKRSPRPPGLYWQLRWVVGCVLRWLESIYIKDPDPFPPGLRTTRGNARAKPLLIWGLGTDCETLRDACLRFANMDIAGSGFAPVLVTDVADFAFFSRLGWLVEYVPGLSGAGPSFGERKARFLARLYRRAPVLPASAAGASWEEIRAHLAGSPAQRIVNRLR
jgi:hypothetical protein